MTLDTKENRDFGQEYSEETGRGCEEILVELEDDDDGPILAAMLEMNSD
jgi:hypothetical protein